MDEIRERQKEFEERRKKFTQERPKFELPFPFPQHEEIKGKTCGGCQQIIGDSSQGKGGEIF